MWESLHVRINSAPVTKPIMVYLVLTLLCINLSWVAVIIDVRGAYQQGKFENCTELYIEVPNGFEEWYPGDVVLNMIVPLYGTKQAVYCFFQTFKKCITNMMFSQRPFHDCDALGVLILLVDDVMILELQAMMEKALQKLETAFICRQEGALIKYIGSKMVMNCNDSGLGAVKFTQPVIICKLC